MAEREEERIDRVDDPDRVLGTTLRRDPGGSRGNFRVVHVLLFNRRGDLLLQRLPATHSRFPGAWGSSVAGHVKAGESYEAAALREMREELGITGVELTLIGKFSLLEGDTRKFVAVYKGSYEGALDPRPEEVAGVRYAPFAEVMDMAEVTPTFSSVVQFILSQG